jgi:hypothetical protein
MSTIEYVIEMSVAPTYGRVSPEASVETISFGTPTGNGEDPGEAPFGVQPAHYLGRATPHRVDGRATVAGLAQRRDVRARGGGDLLLPNVGLSEGLEHTRVDEDDVHALLSQPCAQVVVLQPLGV